MTAPIALAWALLAVRPAVSDGEAHAGPRWDVFRSRPAAHTAEGEDSVWAALMFAEAGAILGTKGAETAVWWSRPVERDDAALPGWRTDLLALAGRMLSAAATQPVRRKAKPAARPPGYWDTEDRERARVRGWLHFTGFLRASSGLFLAGRRLPFFGPGNMIYVAPRSALLLSSWHIPPEAIWVRSPRDLEGRVDIRAARDALQYVRLFTTPMVAFIEGEDGLWGEVVRDRDLTPRHAFGLGCPLRLATELHTWWSPPDGACGLLRERTWAEAKLRPPMVVALPEGYVVVRWLYCASSGWWDPKVYRTAEAVTRTGRVHREVIETRDLGPGVRFSVPCPEL